MADNLADLSIYSLKRKGDGIQDILAKPGLEPISLDLGGYKAYLYIKKPVAKPPKWARLFEGYVDLGQFGKVASTAAVLLIEVDDEWFALAFGAGGKSLIRPDAIKDRFGLLTVLNSIPRDKVRSISKATFDARTQSHVQAARESSPHEFGLDIERDLVRAVTGTPEEPSLGLRLHGMDGLRATLAISLNELPSKLAEFGQRSKAEHYKKHFPWVDHIAPVVDNDLVEELDNRAVELIRAEDAAKCWIAVPEILDWGQYVRFRYGGYKKRNLLHHDIGLDSWIAEQNQFEDGGFTASQVSLNLLRSTRVRSLNAEEEVTHEWPLYNCVYAEVDYKQSSYLLSSGKWYRVDKDFVNEVDAFYASIDPFDVILPEYNDESEGAYNERICANSNGQWASMDQKNIKFGAQTPVEFCDVYTANRDIVHVKRYSQSSVLSHLFAQATVSGELFKTQSAFRGLVNDKLPPSHQISDFHTTPSQEDYRIVYAIVSAEKGDALTLPFFSRLNLRAAVTRLRAYGFRVALSKVHINKELQIAKKYAKDKKRAEKKAKAAGH